MKKRDTKKNGSHTYYKTTFLGFIIFLMHDVNAQNFQWAKNLGGAGIDYAFGIASDNAGNTFGTGHFGGTADFDPGPGIANITGTANNNIYVNSLDMNGNYRWAYGFGTSGVNFGRAVAVANDGSVYVVGDFEGTIDFDPGPGVASVTSSGPSDIFVLKFSNDGIFQWVRSYGGGDVTLGQGVVCGASGAIYVCGGFNGQVNFNPSGTPLLLPNNGTRDAFILKLNPDGSTVWAKSFGGSEQEVVYDIVLDNGENIISIGRFSGAANFNTGTGDPVLISSAGSDDIFIHKMSSDGDFIWARAVGGSSGDRGEKVAVDGNGDIVVVGYFGSTADFNPGSDSYTLTSVGGIDVFVFKLNAQGDFLWANSYGSPSIDVAYGVACDLSGSVFVGGTFSQTVDFDAGPGSVMRSSNGSGDAFLLKLSASGEYQNVITFGSVGDDRITCLKMNNLNEVAISGRFNATVDFDPPNSFNLTVNGANDVFVSKYSTSCVFTAPVEQASNCSAYTWFGQTFTQSGNYILVSPGSNGDCDTLRSLELSINGPIASIIEDGILLVAQGEGTSYQWLNCSLGLIPISQAEQSSFTPFVSGSYAVAITNGACTDTSECVNVIIAAMDDVNKLDFNLFPNPAQNVVYINLPKLSHEKAYLRINSITGEIIQELELTNNSAVLPIDVSTLARGVYFVSIFTNNFFSMQKLILSGGG